MDDLKQLFKENYLAYASYVILDRAIPDVADGLKPVQRRILQTLFQMDDGKLHKVANVSGQTMALHPHGDAPINDALVILANKGYLLERQGNFGNPFTGDPNAAPRYIETKLSDLAKKTLFNPALTTFIPSYDGRNLEPTTLPAKIPLLLMHGAEGIAVGMAAKIFPHNFNELLEAEIALLEGKSIELLPDFPSGGIMDASEYDGGRGKVRVRAKIDIVDDKTLVVKEICPHSTTESLIRSIDEAAKKGKIKIDSINDYTAEKIEIEIKLPRGQKAKDTLDALYAFTDAEVTLHSQVVAIKDKLPWEGRVEEILAHHVTLLKGYLKTELELKRDHLLQTIFQKTLEQIFIENRLYKQIEEVKTYEQIHKTIAKSLEKYHIQLGRVPSKEDREKLLSIPLRRISRFDIEKNLGEIKTLEHTLKEVERHLKNIKKFTIQHLNSLLKTFGKAFPRKTELTSIQKLDLKKIARKKLRLGYDPESGYLGTKVSDKIQIECTNFDKVLILFENGCYQVINVPEKEYIHGQNGAAVFIGVADKKTPFSLLYKDKKTKIPYAKRFIVKQFILEKLYRFIPEGNTLAFLTAEPKLRLQLTLKTKTKKSAKLEVDFNEVAVKGVGTRGIRVANKELKKVKVIEEKK